MLLKNIERRKLTVKALVTIRIILYALVSFIYLLGVVIIGFGNVAMGVPFGKGLLSFTLASAFLELIVYIYLNLVPRYIKWRIGQKAGSMGRASMIPGSDTDASIRQY
jgi:hypothetical protein